MKRIPLLLALLALPVLADEFYDVESGYREEPNHLTPVDREFGDPRFAKLLFQTDGSLGRFLVIPSFTAPSCVSVREAFSGGKEKKYVITLTRASLEAVNNDEKEKVDRTDREISMELAVAVQRVWGKMLHLTRHPAKIHRGLDGTTYQFSVYLNKLGTLHGETWSPKHGLPAEMVSLGEALAEFASDPEAEEKPLIERLRAFEKKIPKAESR